MVRFSCRRRYQMGDSRSSLTPRAPSSRSTSPLRLLTRRSDGTVDLSGVHRPVELGKNGVEVEEGQLSREPYRHEVRFDVPLTKRWTFEPCKGRPLRDERGPTTTGLMLCDLL